MDDYYKILGVPENASEEEIKKAYRKLAHQHHPDKKGGDEKKFKEINEAYQILSNKEKRSQYDRFKKMGGTGSFSGGAYGAGQGPFGGFGGPFSGGGGSAGWDFDFGNGEEFYDLGDVFEAFFGGGAGRSGRHRTYKRGSDIEVIEEITLEESFKGVEKNIAFHTYIKCDKCHGFGHDEKAGMDKCAMCGGKGEIKETKNTFFGSFAQVRMCPQCQGAGNIPKKICEHCKGSGRVRGDRRITLKILPGVADGQIIKIKGAGEAGEKGAEEGDLFVRIKIKSHPVFIREEDNLVVKREINFSEFIASIVNEEKIEIPTISGKKVGITIPKDFELVKPLRIEGEGMPHFNRGGRGDLYVELKLKNPKKVSGSLKKIFEEFKKELGE